MNYIYSTLPTNMFYTIYEPIKIGMQPHIHKILKKILIKGGAGVAHAITFATPVGVRTEVSDEDLELLKKNPVFKTHVENKHIVISDKKTAGDKVGKDMNPRDGSTPATDKYLKSKKINPPTVVGAVTAN